MASSNFRPLSHPSFTLVSPPSKRHCLLWNIVHCDCIDRDNNTCWLDFWKSKISWKLTQKLKQNIKYQFFHAKNHCTRLKITVMSIYEGIGTPWVAREAIISFGRPTLRWDLYFLFANTAWRVSSPFLEIGDQDNWQDNRTDYRYLYTSIYLQAFQKNLQIVIRLHESRHCGMRTFAVANLPSDKLRYPADPRLR